LTLYDSPGLEKSIVDLQLSEMSSFIESKFEETFVEEQKVARAAGTRDTHIHCVLLLLDPTRLQANVNTSSTRSSPGISATTSEHGGMLDATIDIDVLRKLNNLTTVVPIISKADTITVPQMAALKHALHEELGMLDFHPLNVLDFDSEAVSSTDSENDSDNDEGDTNSSRTENNSTSDGENRSIGVAILNLSTPEKQSTTLHADITDIPLSIISPDTYEEGLIGRRFPWGFADPNNGAHCDFPRVKELIFNEWRDDLCEASRVRCYEKWRTTRLKKRTSPQTAYARTNSGDVRIARPGTAHRGTSSNDVGNVASATSIRDEQYKSVVSGMQRL
jgi:septin family protein